MKILFLGDIMGKKTVRELNAKLPIIREKLGLDFVIVNGENASDGFGLTPEISDTLLRAGVDVITTGDHIWNQKDIFEYIKTEPRLLRPLNLVNRKDGLTHCKYNFGVNNEKSILVMGVLGRVFIENNTTKKISSPFKAVDAVLLEYVLRANANDIESEGKKIVDAIFIDMHAEATSEKMAMAHYVDGRVSAVIGTHTHIPTSDACVFKHGTAFQTDAGMCGDYDSSIGMTFESSMNLFTNRDATVRLTVSEKNISLCGAIVEIDDTTGLAKSIEPFVLSDRLKSTHSI